MAWPSPRFTDNGNGTVTDNLTGLIWLKNASCYGQMPWTNALNVANALASGSCGLTDGSIAGAWRLPNVREMQSLIDYGRSTLRCQAATPSPASSPPTTGRVPPPPATRRAPGSWTCTLATWPATTSRTPSTCGRCVADNEASLAARAPHRLDL